MTQAPNKGLSKIAPLGYLDGLATQRGQQNVNFTVVGYGVQFERPNLEIAIKQRFVGTNQLQNLRSHIAGGYNLMMTDSNGGGTGGGGTCFGDSGGPIFHTDTAGNVWDVAVISFGTKYCNGTSGAFRLDNAQARTFLQRQRRPAELGTSSFGGEGPPFGGPSRLRAPCAHEENRAPRARWRSSSWHRPARRPARASTGR